MVNVTFESQDQFKDLHLPTLDCKLQLVNHPNGNASHVTYSYYEKEVNTNYVTIETSAMCYLDKMQALSQEIVRRLSQMDTTREQQENNQILDNFCQKMKRSGIVSSRL